MKLALKVIAALAMVGLFSWCKASSDARYVRQTIPIEIEAGKPVAIKIRSLSGNGWNEVGIRCSPEVWEVLARNKNDIALRLLSSNKSGTDITDVSPDNRKLWPVESFHYLFAIGGEYGARASVEITFKSAPAAATHAEIVVLKTPSDTGL